MNALLVIISSRTVHFPVFPSLFSTESLDCHTQKGYNDVGRQKVFCSPKVILFGSRARGTHSERSDIDLSISGGDFNAFYWDIREQVHSLLTFDVVDLDSGISDTLKKEIERDGITIYEEAR